MRTSDVGTDLVLNGLDGSNPLGFLATIGAATIAAKFSPELRLGWKQTDRGWRPSFQRCGRDEKAFSERIWEALREAPTTVFDIDRKMPFDVDKFAGALHEAQEQSFIGERRNVDLLAAMGTEMYPDKKQGHFQDSHFRMVRSGDSAGQGLPFYIKANLNDLSVERLHHALFGAWDYRDEGYSLRWDPIGDQRYALRWRDPSKSGLADGPGIMLAADCLAAEALQWFPTQPVGRRVETTGFQRKGRREICFVWPIWTPMLGVDTVRSLLVLRDLARDPIDRRALARMGVQEVYRSLRIQQNKYYRNFLPAEPA